MYITFAHSVKYGRYNKFYDDSLFRANLLIVFLDKIKKHINIPENNIHVLFRPIRSFFGRTACFQYKGEKHFELELDVRQPLKDFFDTILHELVHVEQYFEGRLKETRNPNYSKWHGVKMYSNISDLKKYYKLPWENEAYRRAEKLKKIIFTNFRVTPIYREHFNRKYHDVLVDD